MDNVFYRTRQFAISRVLRLTEHKTAERIVEQNGLLKIPELLKMDGIGSVLVVTTAGFIRRKTLEPLLSELCKSNISVTIFSEVMPDPTIECVEKGASLYGGNKFEAIIAIGGGSVMDCAKAIGARIACPKKEIRQMRGLLKVGKKIMPLYAVPTTAGTGSEVTAASVITDTIGGTHYKYSLNDLHLIPKFAILDANLTTGLSQNMTSSTGMDALTHAVEAYTNKFASSYVRKMASQSVAMIFENLPKAYENGQDISARENMLVASCYAGIAFTNNFVGYVHAIAHAVGGLYGIAHGLANAVILPVVMRQFGASVYKPLAELADCVGIKGSSNQQKAVLFIEKIERMRDDMGLPKYIDGLNESDYDEIINRALREANPDYPVPEIWGRQQFEQVLRALTPPTETAR